MTVGGPEFPPSESKPSERILFQPLVKKSKKKDVIDLTGRVFFILFNYSSLYGMVQKSLGIQDRDLLARVMKVVTAIGRGILGDS